MYIYIYIYMANDEANLMVGGVARDTKRSA